MAALFLTMLAINIVVSDEIEFDDKLYLDASQPISVRVDNLLKQMTLNEKEYQLLSVGLNPKESYPYGLGIIQGNGSTPEEIIYYRNLNQEKIMNESRLSIPVAFHQEALHSCCNGGTVFPMPVFQGCTWNISLIEQIASSIAYESRTIGNQILYSPVINLWTDARFGRLSEGYSSNPTLTSFYARSAVKGFQNDKGSGPFSYLPDNSRNAISLAKHFVAYGAGLGGLNAAPSDISKRTLFEYYLKPWKSFGNAGGRAIMTSHQTWNRVPMHANNYLVNEIFRYNKLYNFTEGFIVSDASDVEVLQAYRIAINISQAGARGIIGGVDSDLGGHVYKYLNQSINDGYINQTIIDKSVSRILAAKFATGLFDNNTYITDTNKWKSILNSKQHQDLAYLSVLQGLTLLKVNENKFKNGYSLKDMYINGNLKNIAIIGPNAKAPASTYNGPYTQYNSNANVTVMNILQAFQSKYNDIKFIYEQGVDVQSNSISGISAAVNASLNSDATIIVLGDGTGTCGEWKDNNNLDPPGMQLQLLKSITNALKSKNIALILVLIHGRPYTFGGNEGNIILNDIDLFYSAWRPGQYGSIGIRDVIMGIKENSGRLGQSWPRNTGDILSGSSPFLQEIRGKWVANHQGPQDLDGRRYDTYQNEQVMLGQYADPLFAFGFGLSNTGCNYDGKNQISYSNLKATKINNDKDYIFKVSLTVINNCKIGATDVIQVYLIDPDITNMNMLPIVRYWKRLIGFKKIYIDGNGTKINIVIQIRFDDVAMFIDETYNKFEIYNGNYTVRVGSNSRNDQLVTNIQL